jgi:hypothetical protein
MREGRIESWQEVDFFGGTRIAGNVYECEAFGEGEEMFTSPIVKYHGVMGKLIVETQSGSMYRLGVPANKDRTVQEIFESYVEAPETD